jgi:hypothetical protein
VDIGRVRARRDSSARAARLVRGRGLAAVQMAFMGGGTLARHSLTAGDSVAQDIDMLLRELWTAQGTGRAHAEGRLCSFLFELDQALAAIRAAGVTLAYPPIDEA